MLGLCYDSGKGAELFICKAEEAEGVDTKEIAMRWLSENLNYVDSVTVIDSTGRIIAKQRFNPRYTDEENLAHNQWALGKNLLELFPSLSPEDSTLLQVLHTGKLYTLKSGGMESPGQENGMQQSEFSDYFSGQNCRCRGNFTRHHTY